MAGSDDGAEWNAIATSLIASCQLHGIEPWAYLRDVLTLLPAWPNRDALQLAPIFWNHTRRNHRLSSGSPLRVCWVASMRSMLSTLRADSDERIDVVYRTRTLRACDFSAIRMRSLFGRNKLVAQLASVFRIAACSRSNEACR